MDHGKLPLLIWSSEQDNFQNGMAEMQEKTQNYLDVELQSRTIEPPPYPGPSSQAQPAPVTHQPQLSVMYPSQMSGTMGVTGTMTAVAPGFIVLNQMVPQSTPFHCRSCNQEIVTNVKRKPTFKTHFFAAAFCLACFIPCAIIPYFTDPCKQADHYCPNCDSFIGSYVP